MSVSLASQDVAALTLDYVTRPQAYGLRQMFNDHGFDNSLKVLTKIMIAADVALGSDGDFDRCQMTAANAMHSNFHRSFGFLVMAIRDGMQRRDRDGKAYGKINAQVVNEWTATLEEKVIGLAEEEHARNSFKSDNLGSQYLDGLENTARRDKARITHLSERVEALKAKLGTHE